jgi:hypothetical protein
MIPKWRAGSRPKIKAEVAARELTKLAKKHGGGFTAEDVVNAAKAKRSPLHRCFEWDNTTAATEYRLHQARVLISSLERPDMHVRLFHTDRTIEAPRHHQLVYRSTESILKDERARAELLHRALREAENWAKRYEHLEELAEVVAKMKVHLKKARKRIKKPELELRTE